MNKEFTKSQISLSIDGVDLKIAAIHRDGNLAPIVFLHGFGSTKEDYADIVRCAEFAGHPFLAFDAPGCGETLCADLKMVSVPFLVKTAVAMLEHFRIEKFHLQGHSMGGLTALMLAWQIPARVLSFVDIEGNVAPEDCFLSRQIVDYPNNNDEEFFAEFIERTRHSPSYASALYAASLRHKVRVRAVRGIFESMVELSDHGNLLDKFINVPFPKLFMYGEQNASLAYLSYLEANGVELAEISACGHFPMYSNPIQMWNVIAKFHRDAERNT